MSEENLILICWYGSVSVIYFIISHLLKNHDKDIERIFNILGWIGVSIIIIGLLYPPFNPILL